MQPRLPEIVIVGGGPAGLITAIELGRRGVPVIVLESDPGPPQFPRANATTSRTMEHYRRLGFADAIRARGLPEDYPQDVAYFTRLTGRELARLPGRSRRQAMAAREPADSRWPTPEPLHRGNQMYIEAVLMSQAMKYPAIDLRLGWRGEQVARTEDHVRVAARELATGREEMLEARYVVGCDGPRSIVRSAMGGRYEGVADEDREFMGGRMMAVFFRSPDFYRVATAARSWQYWVVNPERRATIVAVDGEALFVMHVQLPRGGRADRELAAQCLAQAMGRDFASEILGTEEWTAGFTLVADRYVDDPLGPRLFLAGDAAHLFTPTGGQGYNTAVDDAVNLGWKLAAVQRGWGGTALLASYEAERRPIGIRNTSFARAMAESIGRTRIPPQLEEDSPEGARSRQELGTSLAEHARTEFDIPGIHLGVCYRDSPVVCADPAPSPPDNWHRYVPSGYPGARAPHAWTADHGSLYDRFGPDFTLLRIGTQAADRGGKELDRGGNELADRGGTALADPSGNVLADAAAGLGVPLATLDIDVPGLRELYGACLVLVRPDQHVAWRGDDPPADAAAVIRTVTGQP
jgi:2-polyprenyl-6-methoxyphenol hydroxylase-like FAD-dependent oxidoreductase